MLRVRQGKQWQDGGQVQNTGNFTGQPQAVGQAVPSPPQQPMMAGDAGGLHSKLKAVLSGGQKPMAPAPQMGGGQQYLPPNQIVDTGFSPNNPKPIGGNTFRTRGMR